MCLLTIHVLSCCDLRIQRLEEEEQGGGELLSKHPGNICLTIKKKKKKDVKPDL